MALSRSCHPNCLRAMDAQEEHDASQSAALVAVHLISSARVILELDAEYTDYSAQYLVERARPKKEEGNGETDQQRRELTVKAALEFILREGIPKLTHWAHLGCTFNAPPTASYIPRTFMRGEVIETKNIEEAFKLLVKQPVGARLHVFSPEIDDVGDGIYDGPSGNGTSYVGLRDVVILAVEKIEEKLVATVTICYKKKSSYVKVCLRRMFLRAPCDGDDGIAPTALLVDFCVPRLSK